MNKKIQIIFFSSLLLLVASAAFFIFLNYSKADQDNSGVANLGSNPQYHINLDKATIAKGYTVSAFGGGLKLSLVPGILSEDTDADVLELDEPLEMPWQLDRVSKIYQFEFLNKAAYDNHKPFYIQFSYDAPDSNYKQMFFYDKNYSTWRPLPTQDFSKEKFVRSLIHLPYARVAVFSYPSVLSAGKASWYKYKGGNFAASPDFPQGSKLRVYNIDNGKFVDVVINDFGPNRSVHPDRVVDLDAAAFAKLAPKSQGTINISIQSLFMPAGTKIAGIGPEGAETKPELTVKSAILVDEQTGGIMYAKNASTTLPLASLSKLAAIKVFMNASSSLDKVVAYSVKDEEYNYQYAAKGEVARLKVADGETMIVKDLIYAALVGSANNAVETLARASGMPRNEFIKKMNELVAGWGATATHFEEPTGLSPENVSSVSDYAIITKEVYKDPIIQQASTASQYEFSTINTKQKHLIKNSNLLIRNKTFAITGSKTGYLDEAGYCLMTRIKSAGGANLIAVTLGADTRDKSFAETKELLEYGIRVVN